MSPSCIKIILKSAAKIILVVALDRDSPNVMVSSKLKGTITILYKNWDRGTRSVANFFFHAGHKKLESALILMGRSGNQNHNIF